MKNEKKNEKVYERIVRVVSKEDADRLDQIYGTEVLTRCKNCKFADKTERKGEYRCCFHPEEIVTSDFYCGDGADNESDSETNERTE